MFLSIGIISFRVQGWFETLPQQVFSLLSTLVQETIAESGIRTPTAPQTVAIPRIIAGKNILLIAPTGSGKTEAVLLPIFDQLMKIKDRQGLSVIYITPLRALNRDLLKRLDFWSKKLGFTVEIRHGDTPSEGAKEAIDQASGLLGYNPRDSSSNFAWKTDAYTSSACSLGCD